MKEFHQISTFTKHIPEMPTTKLTINTALSKSFTITGLNKTTAPADLVIDWGNGTFINYNDLPASGNTGKTYTGNNIITIIISGSIKENTVNTTYQGNSNLLIADGSILIYNKNNTNSSSNHPLFYKCANLHTLGKDLFKHCINLKSVKYGFRDCSALKNINENLFKYNINLLTTDTCFYNCTSLEFLPFNLFDYNINLTDVYHMCASTGNMNITSTVPDLWNKIKWPKITSFQRCYMKCNKAANWANIPSNWKT